MTRTTAARLADGWDARMRRIHGEITSCGDTNGRYIATVARWLDANRRDVDEWLDAVFARRSRSRLQWRYVAEDPGAELAPRPKTREEIEAEEAALLRSAHRAREAWEASCRRHGADHQQSIELHARWVDALEELRRCRER